MTKPTLEQRVERLERALLFEKSPAESLSVAEKVRMIQSARTKKERREILRQVNGR